MIGIKFKMQLALLFTIIVASQAATISIDPFVVDSPKLFTTASEVQKKLSTLKEEVTDVITGVRTSISETVESASRANLEVFRTGSQEVLKHYKDVRTILEGSGDNHCINDFKDKLESDANIAGYHLRICVKNFNMKLEAKLIAADDKLKVYEKFSADMVMKSFQ